jgi:hypothetical protein
MDFSTKKPREVEAYLRESIRKIFGDTVENNAVIYSHHGYYDVAIEFDNNNVRFQNFRKKNASKIVKAMRALA